MIASSARSISTAHFSGLLAKYAGATAPSSSAKVNIGIEMQDQRDIVLIYARLEVRLGSKARWHVRGRKSLSVVSSPNVMRRVLSSSKKVEIV